MQFLYPKKRRARSENAALRSPPMRGASRFTEKDLQRIADVLNSTYRGGFTLNDTGEEI